MRQEKRFHQKSQQASMGAVADVVLESHELNPNKNYLRGGPNSNVGQFEQRKQNVQYEKKPSKLMTGHWEAIADYMLSSDLMPENEQVRQGSSYRPQTARPNTNMLNLSSPIRTDGSRNNDRQVEQRRRNYEKQYQARHGHRSGQSQRGVESSGNRGSSNHSGWIGDFGNLNSFTVPPPQEPVPPSYRTQDNEDDFDEEEGKYGDNDLGEGGLYDEDDESSSASDKRDNRFQEGKEYREEEEERGQGLVENDFSLSVNDSGVAAAPWTSPLDFEFNQKKQEKDE